MSEGPYLTAGLVVTKRDLDDGAGHHCCCLSLLHVCLCHFCSMVTVQQSGLRHAGRPGWCTGGLQPGAGRSRLAESEAATCVLT